MSPWALSAWAWSSSTARSAGASALHYAVMKGEMPLVSLLLHHTVLGRYIYTVGSDERALLVVGVPTGTAWSITTNRPPGLRMRETSLNTALSSPIASPAEESGAGKLFMVREGAFKDVGALPDAAPALP